MLDNDLYLRLSSMNVVNGDAGSTLSRYCMGSSSIFWWSVGLDPFFNSAKRLDYWGCSARDNGLCCYTILFSFGGYLR